MKACMPPITAKLWKFKKEKPQKLHQKKVGKPKTNCFFFLNKAEAVAKQFLWNRVMWHKTSTMAGKQKQQQLRSCNTISRAYWASPTLYAATHYLNIR